MLTLAWRTLRSLSRGGLAAVGIPPAGHGAVRSCCRDGVLVSVVYLPSGRSAGSVGDLPGGCALVVSFIHFATECRQIA